MRPMVQRVAHGVGHGFGPFLELLPVGGIAGYEMFVHAVGAERAPFVVVALQPDPGQIGEDMIVGHILGREVAVIVYDGQSFRIVMV